MPYPDYKLYASEDFAADEYFIRWVNDPDPETETFWKEWLLAHPDKEETIREAKELIAFVTLQENFPSGYQIDRMRQHIHQRTGRKVVSRAVKQAVQEKFLWYQSWQKVAAVLLAVIVCAALLWLGINKLNTVEHQTAYGQTQSVQLPDGSTVILNANSQLRYSRNWHEGDREVWLDGEAFFEVKHLEDHRKFLVHIQDKLSVEVLGTSFNVFERESGTRVTLQSGKVKLNIGQGSQAKDVFMQPGELVELKENSGLYSRKRINPALASAWTQHKLIFDGTSLSEIVAVLEETYGLRVKVSSPELLEKKVAGSAPTDDVNVFLSALSKSFGLSIKRKGEQVFISSPLQGK